jgi:uncharacterized protein YbcI
MKTQGEMEADICKNIGGLMQEFMGRGPKEIRADIISEMIVVRMKGVLSTAETNLAAQMPSEQGRDLLKSVRTHLVESYRSRFQNIVESATRTTGVSMHHDVSTRTGEEVFVFTMETVPEMRMKNNR